MRTVDKMWLNMVNTFFFIGTIIFAHQANAQGLEKVKTNLETFKDELLTIAPIIAIIALILLGVAYATNMVEKSTFIRWAIGIIIVGSAAQITNMLIT